MGRAKKALRWLKAVVSRESMRNLGEVLKYVIRETVENKMWQAVLIAVVSLITQMMTEPASAAHSRSEATPSYMMAFARRSPAPPRTDLPI